MLAIEQAMLDEAMELIVSDIAMDNELPQDRQIGDDELNRFAEGRVEWLARAHMLIAAYAKSRKAGD